MKSIHIVIAAALLLGLTSCYTTLNLSPLAHRDRVENNWGPDMLKQVQFYLSHDVVLQRKLTGGGTEVVSGKIKIVDGKKIEEVIIPQGTPGVITYAPGDKRLGVAFEEGSDRFLMFGPAPEKGGRYYLLASEWKNRVGKVKYDGKDYYTTVESGNAYLMLDIQKLNKVEVDRRRAGGRTIE